MFFYARSFRVPLVIGGVVVAACIAEYNKTPQQIKNEREGINLGANSSGSLTTKSDVWNQAEKYVKTVLKSTGSADFGSFFGEYQDPDACVEVLGEGKYFVRGWVDSQNSFGAKIRSHFDITLTNEGGAWHCEHLEVDGERYF